jgi:hypothetical protein
MIVRTSLGLVAWFAASAAVPRSESAASAAIVTVVSFDTVDLLVRVARHARNIYRSPGDDGARVHGADTNVQSLFIHHRPRTRMISV